MNDLIRQAADLYSTIDPRDMCDATFYMHPDTIEMLSRDIPDRDLPKNMFGIPVRRDEGLPVDTIHLLIETELDRVIRRASRDGLTVNVVKPVPMMPEVIRETPTLRALLRHWKGKVFRNG